MKKILLIPFLLIVNFSFAQIAKIDSVQKLLRTPKADSTTVNRYIALSRYYLNIDSDSTLVYANKALALSRKIRWSPGEARSLSRLWTYFIRKENNPKALSYALDALEIYERLKDTANIIWCYNDISGIYSGEEDYERAIKYASQGYILSRLSHNAYWSILTSYNLAAGYASLKIPDSALIYFQESYVHANQAKDSNTKNTSLFYTFSGLGRTQLLFKNYNLALSNFQMSLSHLMKLRNPDGQFTNTYWYLAEVYKEMGKTDSSLIYSERGLTYANNMSGPSNRLSSYSQLANLYMGKNNDKAVQYFKLAAELRDSLFTAKRKTEVANLTYNEEERQKELLLQEESDLKERTRNLQYAAIALGLVIFIMLFFLFSHSIIANQKLIRFLGVIALLIVFEFLNLFLHPYLDKLTNHSPVLMLAAMVCIAALLVPLHHKLEHWITNRMVEKNKKIRLAAAKKTIAKLEGEPGHL